MNGSTVCASHGGRAPHVAAAARRRVEVQRAEQAMASLGLPRDVEPTQALLEEVHRTAGHVAWLAGIVGQLERDALVRGITKTVHLPDGSRRVEAEAAVNTWVELYQRERDHLRRVCATAIQAGATERYVRSLEEMAQQLVRAMHATVTALGHDPWAPEVRAAVRHGFMVIADGDVEAST